MNPDPQRLSALKQRMIWCVPLLAILLLFGRSIAAWAFIEFGSAWRIVEILIFAVLLVCIFNIGLLFIEMMRNLSHSNK